MKKHLNFHRLLLVMRNFWFENRTALFLLLLAVASLLTIWMGVYLMMGNPRLFREDFQVAYYFIGLLLSGCLSANFLFADLGNKPKAISYLLLPATSLEKMIGVLFFGVIVFLIGYTLAFYLVNVPMVTLANKFNSTHWKIINIFTISQYEDPFFEGRTVDLFFKYLICQGLFIAGSMYFHRYTFFKTAIVCLFIAIILVLLPGMIHFVLPSGTFYQQVTAYEILDFRGNKLVQMPGWFNVSLSVFVFYVIPVALWLVSYFRLREQQVS